MSQLVLFNGREVAEVRLKIPGLGEIPYVPDDGDYTLAEGDELEVTMRLKVTWERGGAPCDKDGITTASRAAVYETAAIRPGFRITALRRAADLEAAWRGAHGA